MTSVEYIHLSAYIVHHLCFKETSALKCFSPVSRLPLSQLWFIYIDEPELVLLHRQVFTAELVTVRRVLPASKGLIYESSEPR